MKNMGQRLILISFLLALTASIAVFVYLQSLKTPGKTIKRATILVAAEKIPPRMLIDKKMVKEIQVLDKSVFSDCESNISDIVGKYTKETVSKNEGFFRDKLMSKDSNELSMKVNDNYRAISINVMGESGVSELIKPEDYVDVIAYLAEKKEGNTIVRPDMAKVVLQNIEILAVNKQLNRNDDITEDKGNNSTNFLVTLSVPTSQLEKLVLAESIGSIKLALRPLKDKSKRQTDGTTWEELIIDKKNSTPTKSIQKSSAVNNEKKSKYINYTVKRGDTLKKISNTFYGNPNFYERIKKANNIGNDNIIITGEIIKIPQN